MKIAFINAVIGADFSTLDVSVTLLASIINKNTRHKAYIFDTTFHPKDWKTYLDKKIKTIKPDILAFSCNTLYMNYIKKIASYLKKKYNIPILGGGYHATVYPKSTIKEPYIDAILIGDGDEKLPTILDYVEKNHSFPKDIKGFWVKEGNKITENGKGDFYNDVSNFPHLDWTLWEDIDKYLYFLQMIYFVGNRGCPFTCPFCEACEISQFVDGKYFREINPERYAQEIVYQWKIFKKRGMKLAQLFDPIPTINLEWVKRFCNEYKSLVDPKTHPFSMFSRFDSLTEEKIKRLSQAGCVNLRCGIESGDYFIRKNIHQKNITNEKIFEVSKLLKKYKINLTAYFILGAPGESKKSTKLTEKMAQKIDASRTAFFLYKPITKRSMELLIEQKGTLDKKRYNKSDNLQYTSVIALKDLSCAQIQRIQYKLYLKYLIRKVTRLIKHDGIMYFINLAIYVFRGLRDGLKLKYLLPYYHIYAYDHYKL